MSSGSDLASLAEACRSAPQDPGARAKLIAHCKEAEKVLTIIQKSTCQYPSQVSSQLLEALADIARTEEGREAVMGADILPNLFSRTTTDFVVEEMALQTCRLGGNLCFDSPEGRRQVEEAGLFSHLIVALPHLPSPPGKIWQVLPAFLIIADIVNVIIIIIRCYLHSSTTTAPTRLPAWPRCWTSSQLLLFNTQICRWSSPGGHLVWLDKAVLGQQA